MLFHKKKAKALYFSFHKLMKIINAIQNPSDKWEWQFFPCIFVTISADMQINPCNLNIIGKTPSYIFHKSITGRSECNTHITQFREARRPSLLRLHLVSVPMIFWKVVIQALEWRRYASNGRDEGMFIWRL